MPFPEPQALPLPVNAAAFLVGAGIIWYAGSHLAHYADRVARTTAMSEAFVGLVLLGVATSLPEIVSTVTASLGGNARLAVNNLFGGVSLQIAVLAVADAAGTHRALTYFAHRPEVILQGVLLVVMLAVAAVALAVGSPFTIGSIGPWTLVLFALYVGSVGIVKQYQGREEWYAEPRQPNEQDRGMLEDERLQAEESAAGSRAVLAWKIGAASAAILVAGVLVTTTGEAIGEQTGIGSSLAGALLVAGSSSLPELSTTITAVRLGNNAMALSNILGTNLLRVGLLLLADVTFLEGPVLDALGTFPLVAVLLGILVTCAYLIGIIERRNQTVWRMGVDSLAVLLLYAGGVVVLYQLR